MGQGLATRGKLHSQRGRPGKKEERTAEELKSVKNGEIAESGQTPNKREAKESHLSRGNRREEEKKNVVKPANKSCNKGKERISEPEIHSSSGRAFYLPGQKGGERALPSDPNIQGLREGGEGGDERARVQRGSHYHQQTPSGEWICRRETTFFQGRE